VHLVEDFGTEILKPFGGIGKSLFEPISFDDNMPDHFPLIRHKGAFTFGIDGRSKGGGIGMSSCNGIPEELEYIVIHDPVHMAAGCILYMPSTAILHMPAAAIRHLAE
jgi:hypothetical protein